MFIASIKKCLNIILGISDNELFFLSMYHFLVLLLGLKIYDKYLIV